MNLLFFSMKKVENLDWDCVYKTRTIGLFGHLIEPKDIRD